MRLPALEQDLLLAVCHHLDAVALCSLACTCRRLRVVAEMAELWHSLAQQRWFQPHGHLLPCQSSTEGRRAWKRLYLRARPVSSLLLLRDRPLELCACLARKQTLQQRRACVHRSFSQIHMHEGCAGQRLAWPGGRQRPSRAGQHACAGQALLSHAGARPRDKGRGAEPVCSRPGRSSRAPHPGQHHVSCPLALQLASPGSQPGHAQPCASAGVTSLHTSLTHP